MKKVILCSLIVLLSSGMWANGNPTKKDTVILPQKYLLKESDIMWKRTVWRVMNFYDQRNRPYNVPNRELTRVILDAALQNELKTYVNDSLTRTLTSEELKEKLQIPQEEGFYSANDSLFLQNDPDAWTDTVSENMRVETMYYSARDFYEVELKQEYVFDKNHSRMYRRIVAVTLYITHDHPMNVYGVNMPIASFDYVDLIKEVFTKDTRAKYATSQNAFSMMNFYESMENELFYGHITKINNFGDVYLVDQSGGNDRAAWWKGINWEHKLMEFEHNLWTY